MLNLDCDHYINNSKAVREAMCFLMDPQLGKKLCYVQFPQRFHGIDLHDRYANRNVVFFDVSPLAPYQISITICNTAFSTSYQKFDAGFLFRFPKFLLLSRFTLSCTIMPQDLCFS